MACIAGVWLAAKSMVLASEEIVTECDQLAADPDDPDKITEGVEYWKIHAREAVNACAKALESYPENKRLQYQLFRAQWALGESDQRSYVLEAMKRCRIYSQYCVLYVQMADVNFDGDPELINNLMAAMGKNHVPTISYVLILLANYDRNKSGVHIADKFLPRLLKETKSRLAASAIATLFFKGYGVEENIDEALFWEQKAVNLGRLESMFPLAGYYYLKRNYEMLEYWLCLSIEEKVPSSALLLEMLKLEEDENFRITCEVEV